MSKRLHRRYKVAIDTDDRFEPAGLSMGPTTAVLNIEDPYALRRQIAEFTRNRTHLKIIIEKDGMI